MELYHVLNRGVDKRDIFLDGHDHARFVHNLYEFNDLKPITNNVYRMKNIDLRNRYDNREKIVDVHGWCLMKNHYHLLLSERAEGGLVKFIRRLNIGYAKYFNEKYKRIGTLFQGRTKKILIKSDGHFLHILHYIHLNPLDHLPQTATWRERRIGNAHAALKHLDQYKWSSYLDYSGERNFPSILTTTLFGDIFRDYKKEVGEYLKDIELKDIGDLLLE